MNTPLRRLATVVVGMFLVLMGAATWVQFVTAPALNDDGRNVRTLYREYGNARGPIVVGGNAIASSVPVDDPFGYQRTYADPGELYAHVTGYYSVVYQRSGIEEWMNTELNGSADSLFYSRLEDLVTGRQPQGSSVERTIDPAVQAAAVEALGNQRGAVVALDPTTGAILALVSKPSFDPEALAGHDTAAVTEAWTALQAAEGDPMSNRAIAGNTYPPGSTFKLVTAAAAIESGDYDADSMVPGGYRFQLPQSETTIGNYDDGNCGGRRITLTQALQVSCNVTFLTLANELGNDAMAEQAEKFGFNDTALEDLGGQATSLYPRDMDAPQTAMSGIGQSSVTATPLQMAMVAAAIANDGDVMRP